MITQAYCDEVNAILPGHTRVRLPKEGEDAESIYADSEVLGRKWTATLPLSAGEAIPAALVATKMIEVRDMTIRREQNVTLPLTPLTMSGVRELTEGYEVQLVRDRNSGRLAIRARNEGGNNETLVDLRDVMEWMRPQAAA